MVVEPTRANRSHLTVAAFLSTVALFSVGFLIRPLGAFVFGWLGDRVGRKYTFLVTLSGMGLSTAVIGVLPTYAQVGLAAAFLLFVLRLIQGLCLGGEYGGRRRPSSRRSRPGGGWSGTRGGRRSSAPT